MACGSPSGTADPGRPPFCPKPGAELCADFGSATEPGAGWTSVSVHGAAMGSVVDRSFLVTVPPSAATTSGYAPYWETMAPLNEASVQLAFRAETLPAILTIAVVVHLQDQYAVGLQIAMGNLYVIEQRMGVIDTPFIVGRVGTGWHTYELVVSPERRKLEARVDGSLSSFGMAANQKFTLAGKKTISVGIVDSSATLPAAIVRFDDVALFAR